MLVALSITCETILSMKNRRFCLSAIRGTGPWGGRLLTAPRKFAFTISFLKYGPKWPRFMAFLDTPTKRAVVLTITSGYKAGDVISFKVDGTLYAWTVAGDTDAALA